jgi:hypothetical protein
MFSDRYFRSLRLSSGGVVVSPSAITVSSMASLGVGVGSAVGGCGGWLGGAFGGCSFLFHLRIAVCFLVRCFSFAGGAGLLPLVHPARVLARMDSYLCAPSLPVQLLLLCCWETLHPWLQQHPLHSRSAFHFHSRIFLVCRRLCLSCLQSWVVHFDQVF